MPCASARILTNSTSTSTPERSTELRSEPRSPSVFQPAAARQPALFLLGAGGLRVHYLQPGSVFNAPCWIRFTPAHFVRKSSSNVSSTSGRRRFTSSSAGGSSSGSPASKAGTPVGRGASVSAPARGSVSKAVSASSPPCSPDTGRPSPGAGETARRRSRASSSLIRSFFFRRRRPRLREPAPPAPRVP